MTLLKILGDVVFGEMSEAIFLLIYNIYTDLNSKFSIPYFRFIL